MQDKEQKVAIVENPDMGITLPDGTRLSARVWMPEDAEAHPVPAILEFLPYRKRDGTAARDQITHPYFAEHGYAAIRVDMRGCGESEGLFDDEYSPTEMRDAVDTINWIAAQPWCTGRVGMMGISWGGFNSLQVAALAPEPLKAVITIGSTTDRYADDIHYKGGVMLGENIGWVATATSWFSTPPDPALVGDKWRDIWLDRLKNMPDLAPIWLGHQHRDAYWKHGSVCENYAAIKAAVLTIGGWHDGYRNTPAHLAANLKSPVKALVGPWNHKYPHMAVPGPRIGFLHEALRWWDHWLKDLPTSVENDPAYTCWLMDSVAPEVSYEMRPGRWITEPVWPAPGIATRKLALGPNTLGEAPETPFVVKAFPSTGCGMATGEYFPFGFGPGELPDDQRGDDALSACFDSKEMAETTDIVGAPRITLDVATDTKRAHLVVRLTDLRPDGSSALITMGIFNLRHRTSREFPEDMVPSKTERIGFALDQIAYRLPKGHRLRIAVSTSYWPFVWPEAEPVTATLSGGTLDLPVRPTTEGSERDFPPPDGAPPLPVKRHGEGAESKRIETDVATGETRIVISGQVPLTEDLTHGLVTANSVEEVWSIKKNDPASARVDMVWTRQMGRNDWWVKTRLTTTMTGDAGHFHVRQKLTAYEGENCLFERDFGNDIDRI